MEKLFYGIVKLFSVSLIKNKLEMFYSGQWIFCDKQTNVLQIVHKTTLALN